MSENEDMYLVIIARNNEAGIDPVAFSILAQELNLQPVSANQMIKKLETTQRLHFSKVQPSTNCYARNAYFTLISITPLTCAFPGKPGITSWYLPSSRKPTMQLAQASTSANGSSAE